MTTKEYAKCLRQIAKFYDSVDDDFPLPDGGLTKSYYFNEVGTKELVMKIARALGDCQKDYTGHAFMLIKDFRGLALAFTFSREAVCEKKVIGFKDTPGYTIPPGREEIIEWECKSILSQEEANALHHLTRTEETTPPSGENPNRPEG